MEPTEQIKKVSPTRIPEGAPVVTLYPDAFAERMLSYGEPHPNWHVFAKICTDRSVLDRDAVYALPDPLITAVVKYLPRFFSAEEQHVERELTRLSGAGFFLRRPFGYPRLPSPTLSTPEAELQLEQDEKHVNVTRKIREMLNIEMRKSGRSEEEIKNRQEAELNERANVEIRQRAYAAWLVTNAEFRRDRDCFRMRWASTIHALGGFPTIPFSLMGEKPLPPNEEYRDFYDEYKHLCITWGLERFATWDLPCPMRPELTSPNLYHLPAIREAGITAFLPWYLLRDKDIQLDELAKRIRTLSCPEHLKDWLDHEPRDWGYDRFALMLGIYIFVELCLRSRYPDRLKGNTELLDPTFRTSGL